MNSSIQIFKRFLSLRRCNRIICSRYNNDSKIDGQRGVNSRKNDSNQSPQMKTNTEHEENQNLDSLTENIVATSPKISPEFEVAKSSLRTHHKGRSQKNYSALNNINNAESKNTIGEKRYEIIEGDSDTVRIQSISNNNMEEGFLAAFKKQEKILNESTEREQSSTQGSETFVSLLRKSPFIDMGDPIGKVVLGEIYLVVENDLYIDFGWKFHTVCPKPKKNSEKYLPGVKVLLRIKDLELSAKFLGDKKYISLLEADCDIIGLYFKEKEPKYKKLQDETN